MKRLTSGFSSEMDPEVIEWIAGEREKRARIAALGEVQMGSRGGAPRLAGFVQAD